MCAQHLKLLGKNDPFAVHCSKALLLAVRWVTSIYKQLKVKGLEPRIWHYKLWVTALGWSVDGSMLAGCGA